MDFFASQDAARRKTKWLLGYFALAILGITTAIYITMLVAVAASEDRLSSKRSSRARAEARGSFTFWRPELFLQTALGTLAVVGLGSGYKSMQLSGGGSVVARDLGGRLLDRQTRNPDERKLLNIVEEMAIASGIPVPDVYLLENEEGINAFAAGKTTGDAVVGVTRGCMTRLNRDELQGVIAHEFSHILNGDMRLNLRLIGLLHGILIIAIIGRVVLELSGNSRSSNGEKKGGGLIFVGLALLIIGYLGVFFARMIQAAVSRQREYLADASAVQFTRNPLGISGALQKIGGSSFGSKLKSSMADECEHMMFGESVAGLFATHPPLDDRIRKVNPQWDGKFINSQIADIGAGRDTEDSASQALPSVPGALPSIISMLGAVPPPPRSADQAVDRIGTLGEADLAHARSMREAMPVDWMELLRDSSGAQAMIFALVLSQDDSLRDSEIRMLRESVDADTLAVTLQLQPQVHAMPSTRTIALIDIAVPALRRLSPAEYERFKFILEKLMVSDNRIDLFEFMLQKCLRRHLDIYYNLVAPSRVEFRQLQPLAGDAHCVLSHLAEVGGRDPDVVLAAYAQGAAQFQASGVSLPEWAPQTDMAKLNTSLDRLDRAAPLVKKQFLYACGRTVLADQQITNEESELLRAVADAIGCPIPPFVAQAAS